MALTACDGDDAPPETSAPATTTTLATATSIAVDNVSGYFEAVAQRAVASTAAAPASDAALFVQHQAAVRQLLPASTPVLTPTSVPAGVDLCDAAGACVSYSDISLDPNGLVATFSIDGQPLAGRVAGAGVPVEQDGVSVGVTSAYQTTAGDLLVVVEITSTTDVGIELFGFAAVLDGGETSGVEASGAWGATSVVGFASGRQLIAFPQSTPAGRLLVTGLRSDGVDVSFDVRIPDPN